MNQQPTGLPLIAQCPECKEMFSRKSHLRTHIAKKHPEKPELWAPSTRAIKGQGTLKCPHCDTVLAQRSSLSRHISRAHKDLKTMFPRGRAKKRIGDNFICYECTFTYSSRSQFKEHVKQQHPELCHILDLGTEDEGEQINPFSCDQCYARFNTQRKLTFHKKAHAKDKLRQQSQHSVEDQLESKIEVEDTEIVKQEFAREDCDTKDELIMGDCEQDLVEYKEKLLQTFEKVVFNAKNLQELEIIERIVGQFRPLGHDVVIKKEADMMKFNVEGEISVSEPFDDSLDIKDEESNANECL